jgi:hypothetical protein
MCGFTSTKTSCYDRKTALRFTVLLSQVCGMRCLSVFALSWKMWTCGHVRFVVTSALSLIGGLCLNSLTLSVSLTFMSVSLFLSVCSLNSFSLQGPGGVARRPPAWHKPCSEPGIPKLRHTRYFVSGTLKHVVKARKKGICGSRSRFVPL